MVTDPKVSTSIFRASGVLGRVPQEINEYVIRKLGVAAAQFLRAEVPSGSRLVVACDLRDNSRGFSRIFCEGASCGSMNTLSLGPSPPELLAFVLGTDGCTGGAFIGGGTHADNVSGVRVWRGDASPVHFASGLEKIALIARRLRTGHSRLPGESTAASPVGEYLSYVRKFAPELGPLKVVVDGGYGAAGSMLESLFVESPVEMVSLHFQADGHNQFLGRRFPCSAVVSSLRAKVREVKADFGAAFDFSGERIAFVDEKGQLLGHDVAAGLISSELLGRQRGARVAYDLRSTACLKERIARDGGQAVAAPVRPVAFAQHFRRADALYGADLSGLHYFKDLFRFPSPFVALLLLSSHVSRQGRPLSELAADLNRFARSDEIVIALPARDAAQKVLASVRDEFPDAEREMVDGLSVRLEDWWFNLRQPGEEAELRLNVEGRTRRDLRRGRQNIERLVSRVLSTARA
jgi:phosphomannomutase